MIAWRGQSFVLNKSDKRSVKTRAVSKMTALSKYDRLEATGLWRINPSEQRREVVVSIGDATLIISDINDTALTHWSLAAVEKAIFSDEVAIFFPDGDPEETLELAFSEKEMIEAIDILRQAVLRTRPHPGRVRWLGAGLTLFMITVLTFLWLPGALVDHALRVVPAVKEAEIGKALLKRIERVSGPSCWTSAGSSGLRALAERTSVDSVVVLPGGVREALALPGGTILINRSLIEEFDEPDVAAGYLLAEKVRNSLSPPLRQLLESAGIRVTAKLLTTGQIPEWALDAFAEAQLASPTILLPADILLPIFADANISSTPFALTQKNSDDKTKKLIKYDPIGASPTAMIMRDADWLQLQVICAE